MPENLSASSEPYETDYADNHDISYAYSIKWIDGCVTEAEEQNWHFPLGTDNTDVNADGLLRGCFTDCKFPSAFLVTLLHFREYICKERDEDREERQKLITVIIGNNEGVGGSRQVGCLEYTYTGGKQNTIPLNFRIRLTPACIQAMGMYDYYFRLIIERCILKLHCNISRRRVYRLFW